MQRRLRRMRTALLARNIPECGCNSNDAGKVVWVADGNESCRGKINLRTDCECDGLK